MIKRECSLTRASTYFMGGGGGDAPSVSGAIGDAVGSFPQIQSAYRKFARTEPLLKNLTQFGLQAGGAISPYILDILRHPYDVPHELLNWATQGARAGSQARGNIFSGEAVASELMGREQTRQQRISSALGQAGQVEQLYGYPEQVRTSAFATLMNPAYGLAGQALGAQTAADAQGKSGTQSAVSAGVGILGAAATAY
jgi:hypothetical protein